MKTAALMSAIVIGALALGFGYLCLVGWIADLAYSAVMEPGKWNIDYWPMVGIVFVASVVFGGSTKAAR